MPGCQQLDLPFWPRGSLREAVSEYLLEAGERVAPATMGDYRDRAEWVCQVFGEATPIEGITYPRLRDVVREWGPSGKGLMLVTVRRRLVFLRAALRLAAQRGVIPKDGVPDLPRLPPDGKRREVCLSLDEYGTLRANLAGIFRRLFEVAFWTGLHRRDLWEMRRWQLDPGYVWRADDGAELWRGRWWRVNTKNRRCKSCWVPAEPEWREIMADILAENAAGDSLVTGRVGAYHKALRAGCDRAGMGQRVSLIDCRHSHATLLMARHESYEYVRLILGHEGEAVFGDHGEYRKAARPSTLSRHYLHASSDALMGAVRRSK